MTKQELMGYCDTKPKKVYLFMQDQYINVIKILRAPSNFYLRIRLCYNSTYSAGSIDMPIDPEQISFIEDDV